MWYRKRGKYNNKRTVYNGRRYDSKLEARVAVDIDLLKKSGKVVEVEPQKRFDLHGPNGSRICSHIVDFLLTYQDGHQEVWEAKGVATDVWTIKRKLFCDEYPTLPYYVITAKETKLYAQVDKTPAGNRKRTPKGNR